MTTAIRLPFFLLPLVGAVSGQTATSVSLSNSPNPANYGQAVTLDATLTAGAAGKVTFYDGVTILGISTISGSHATLTTKQLSSGQRSLRAYYQGNGAFSPSSSAPVPETVVAGVSAGFRPPVSYALGTTANSGVALADFNEDGNLDIAIAKSLGAVVLLRGNGDGSFQTPTLSGSGDPSCFSLISGDFNGDGHSDLATACSTSQQVAVLLGNGNGTFQAESSYPTEFSPHSLATGDFNGDGLADIAVTESSLVPGRIGILLGSGAGAFQSIASYPVAHPITAVTVADLTGDGKADLVVGGWMTSTLLGNGDGTFQTNFPYSTRFSYRVGTGDLNGDNRTDFVASSFPVGVVVFASALGSSIPAPSAPYLVDNTFDVALEDVNGDGRLDVLTSGDGLSVLSGNGDGTLQSAAIYPTGNFREFSLATGDFNGDGKVDVVLPSDSAGAVFVLLGGASPELSTLGFSVSSSHSGTFTFGQTGATYSLIVAKSGASALTGILSVVDKLPFGFTATAMSGDGWNCILSTLTCTRADTLASGAYPPITLTVNVTLNSPATVENRVTLTNSGPSNVTATDRTYVAPFSSNTPTVISGVPSVSNNNTQSFYFRVQDLDGYQDINNVYFLINTVGITGPRVCHGYINRASDRLFLLGDDGASFFGPIMPSSPIPLQNSQCSIGIWSSTVFGTEWQINIQMTKKGTYVSVPENVYLWVKDNEGYETGWVQTGVWGTVGANPPVVVSGTPSATLASTATFTFTAADPDGYSDINNVYFLINTSTAIGANNCHGYYNRASNTLWLLNDAATAFLGPLTAGANGVLQNSQCAISGPESTVVQGLNTTLALNLRLTKQGSYATAPENVYLWVKDNEGLETGWLKTGTWGTSTFYIPTVVSGLPVEAVSATQTFVFRARDITGFEDINNVYFLVNTNTSITPNNCHGYYNRISNTLWLYNQAGTGFLGPLTPGSAGSLNNGQCSIAGTGSSAVGTGGTELVITLAMAKLGSYASTFQNVYLWVKDNGGLETGWVQTGTWGTGQLNLPSVVSGTPVSAPDNTQTFSFTGRDLDGYADIGKIYFLVNTSTAITAYNCHGFYDRGTNAVWLFNQTATGFLGPLTPGTAGTLDNGQCSVSGPGSSVLAGPGSDLTVNLAMSKFGFYASATENVYLWVKDNESHDTGWVKTGTWGAIPTNRPSVVSGTPANATGNPRVVTFTGRDMDGSADIARIYFLINKSTAITANNCHGFFDKATGTLWLLNDAGTDFLGPYTQGGGGGPANSQCSIAGWSGTPVTTTDVQLILTMTKLGGYAGASENVYLWVKDNEGQETGWVQTGTWDATATNPPTVVSGLPVSSTNANQLFSFTGRDLDGYADINNIYFLINTSTAITANNCHGYYNRASNTLWLYNDTATGFLGPLTPGANATLQNGQCSINGAGSTVTVPAGTDLALNLTMTLRGAYTTAAQKVYLWVKDNEGNETGWLQTGVWSAN